MKKIRFTFFPLLPILAFFVFASCSEDDAPVIENEEEVISEATLIFTPVNDSSEPLTFTYSDADGDGPQQPVQDPIVLQPNTDYTLTIELAGPNNEDITEEILEEADEHMLFFGWSGDIFSDPTGTGNISSRSGTVNYSDSDSQNLPLGLTTNWTTASAATGTFTTVLKHQPDIKSTTSTATDGETDLQIDWDVTVQ